MRRKHLILALVLAASFGGGVLVRLFVGSIWLVPSSSMSPTLETGQLILTLRPGSGIGSLERGDVVVFDDPGGWLTDDVNNHSGALVKRVIGLPGDTVSCATGADQMSVNGEYIDETAYLGDTAACTLSFEVTVPDGSVWVMGDNRSNSADSRYHQDLPSDGFVDARLINGRVVWPNIRA
ncbi:signal peptidase I [Pseudoclavibacter soli]|uniref:signal peptidase I n=1 Tax=Pseudoclavibacter soli TaxID=452623 RepID=UPI0004140F33|nr:signal peptidase I [Pseudoclavibacter soli]